MAVFKNSLGRQALIQAEQEACNAIDNIFDTLSNKVKHQCNETVKSLQYCKLNRHNSTNGCKRMQLSGT